MKLFDKHNQVIFGILLLASVLGFSSCNNEMNDSEEMLQFSTDTLTFDTIFSSMGSVTSKILIYNHSNNELKINRLELKGGSASAFRLNADGLIDEDHSFSNIVIAPNDSMYLFVEVNIDPNDANAPIVVEDSIIVETALVTKKIVLEAFGQNMILLNNITYHDDTTLDDTKPYLVYGDLVVDSAKTLRLLPGSQLYFHNNANLIVMGHLKSEGTAEKPVELRGDRMDKIRFETPVAYHRVAGQWGGVYLLHDQGNHVIRHTNLYSGNVGVYLNNTSWSVKPLLKIENSRIHNFLFYGLVVINSDVKVYNSEISNTGSFSVYLNGGHHEFIHTTLANYYNNNPMEPSSRDANPALMLMHLGRSLPMQVAFRNCVIAGTNSNEMSIASKFPNQFPGLFDHCYIRRSKAIESTVFANVSWSAVNDTVFKQTSYDFRKDIYFNFMPDSVSPARGIADLEYAKMFPLDLNGKSRLQDGKPDAGAYEWQGQP